MSRRALKMEKKSCGAILYTFNPDGELGVILGDESRNAMDGWLPFKGGCREDETVQQAAIREIYEETCGLVKLETIDLQHKFTTKRKEYHIGLCGVSYELIHTFDIARKKEYREDFMEKKELKFFKFPGVLKDTSVHNISKSSILFYKDVLENLQNSSADTKLGFRARCLGISNTLAEAIKSETNIARYARPIRIIQNTNIQTHPHIKPSTSVSNLASSASVQDLRVSGDISKYRRNTYPKPSLITRPKRFNISFTPRAEKIIEQNRVWRHFDPPESVIA